MTPTAYMSIPSCVSYTLPLYGTCMYAPISFHARMQCELHVAVHEPGTSVSLRDPSGQLSAYPNEVQVLCPSKSLIYAQFKRHCSEQHCSATLLRYMYVAMSMH